MYGMKFTTANEKYSEQSAKGRRDAGKWCHVGLGVPTSQFFGAEVWMDHGRTVRCPSFLIPPCRDNVETLRLWGSTNNQPSTIDYRPSSPIGNHNAPPPTTMVSFWYICIWWFIAFEILVVLSLNNHTAPSKVGAFSFRIQRRRHWIITLYKGHSMVMRFYLSEMTQYVTIFLVIVWRCVVILVVIAKYCNRMFILPLNIPFGSCGFRICVTGLNGISCNIQI